MKKSIFLLLPFLIINNSYGLDFFNKLKDQGSQLVDQGSKYVTENIKKLPDSSIISDISSQIRDNASKLLNDQINVQKNNVINYIKNASDNKHANEIAQIRSSSKLPEQEQQIIQKRLKLNNEALSKILNQKIQNNQNLNIAFCASGGGYRALTATLGSLHGAQIINLLDATTYMAGLSGGAWAFATWVSSGKSINEFINMTKQNLANNAKFNDITIPHVEDSQIQNIIKNLMNFYIYNLPITSVNLWGSVILDNLLNPINNRHNLTLTSQQNLISNANKPFPIYTAVEPISSFKYNWFEFTPFEIGNISANTYVPSWGFGRKFSNTKSIENSPELPLDFYLGIFGSAFTVSPEELEDKLNLKKKIVQYLQGKFKIDQEILDKVIDLKPLFNELENKNIPANQALSKRFIPGQVYNPNFGVHGDTKKDIILVDAGIDFNLPLPPLLRSERNIDIIFVLDASGSVTGGEELVRAEQYAKKNNLKFPKIDYSRIDKFAVNIFGLENNDHEVPIIVYMPRINPLLNMKAHEIQNLKLTLTHKDAQLIDKLKSFDPDKCSDSSFCSTYNFAYTSEQFDLLSNMTYLNMVMNKDKIHNAIKLAFNRKYKTAIKI